MIQLAVLALIWYCIYYSTCYLIKKIRWDKEWSNKALINAKKALTRLLALVVWLPALAIVIFVLIYFITYNG